MTHAAIARPGPDEYDPFYAGYVGGVPDGDPLALLDSAADETRRLYERIGEARAGEPTAPGKWSPKDVLQHVVDGERVFAYRALRIARGDATPPPGFDQDLFAAAAGAAARALAALLAAADAVRAATIALFDALDEAAFARRGTASEAPVSVRALLYVILGHEAHHQRALAAALPAPAGR